MARPVHRKFALQRSKLRLIPFEADPVVTADGVKLHAYWSSNHFTPDELEQMARWFFALSKEARELASRGLISEESGYDVLLAKLVRTKVDKNRDAQEILPDELAAPHGESLPGVPG
jgi:hypothetical protein